jgi:hypothetical protein
MADETLLTLAQDVRGLTLRMLDGLSESDAQFHPPGLKNTILWNAGHALVVVEHLSVAPLSDKRAAADPPGYFETFSWKSDPAKVTSWPALAEVRGHLNNQLTRLLHLIRQADTAALARVVDQQGRTVRHSVVHGLHDEAVHQGQIYLMRKMLNVTSASG